MPSVELDVEYIKQTTPTTCWNAGYKMMLRWTYMYESLADSLPHDKEMRVRGILDSEFAPCRMKLGMGWANYQDLSTPEGLAKQLESNGPIWCAGYWATDFSVRDKPDFKHVVVIRGVKTHFIGDDEVYVNDPYRGYSGAAAAPSWWSWSHFWNKLHKVPQNCQYWKQIMDEDACRRLQRVSALFEIRMLNLIPLLEELKLAVQAEGSKAR